MISSNLKKRTYTSAILILISLIIFTYNPILVFFLLLIGNFSIIEFSNLIKRIFKKKILRLIFNIAFIIYIFLFCFFFFLFSNILFLKKLLFLFLFCCVASDIGGYIFGKLLKGPKLTKISPKKTIAGAVGSIIFCCLMLFSVAYYSSVGNNLKILILGFMISVACQIGDIFFSFMKRKAKVKDTESYLPGHGGILDRIDGMLLGIPLGFIFLSILY